MLVVLLVLLGCGAGAEEIEPLLREEAPAVLYDAEGAFYCVRPGYKYSHNLNIYRLQPGQVKADCALLKGGRP